MKKYKEITMHNQHDVFINAIYTKKKLRIRFYSEEDRGYIEWLCAPMDYAAGKRIHDGIPCYWVWNFESDKANHTLPLRAERIEEMNDFGYVFDPASFFVASQPGNCKKLGPVQLKITDEIRAAF